MIISVNISEGRLVASHAVPQTKEYDVHVEHPHPKNPLSLDMLVTANQHGVFTPSDLVSRVPDEGQRIAIIQKVKDAVREQYAKESAAEPRRGGGQAGDHRS